MDNFRDCAGLFVDQEGPVTMAEFDPVFLPNEVFYKQLHKTKKCGEKVFKQLDKYPPKTIVPLSNYLALNERFQKVMTKCLLPEDFGLNEFNQEFIRSIHDISSEMSTADSRRLWGNITTALTKYVSKYRTATFEVKRKRLAQHILRELWSEEPEKMDEFLVGEVSKKVVGKYGKKGLWKKKMKLVVSNRNVFEHVGKKYLSHKSKLQMGKKWLFYTYVSRIRSNSNSMALMRLKVAFKNFQQYAEPLHSPPEMTQQPGLPIGDEHAEEVENDSVVQGTDDANEASNLEKALQDYLDRAVFGYETGDDESDSDDGGTRNKRNWAGS